MTELSVCTPISTDFYKTW